MAPFSTIYFGLLLCTVCVVGGSPSAQEHSRSSHHPPDRNNSSANCPEAVALRDVIPQNCCHSFQGVHNAIIDCLTQPLMVGSCIGHCLMQNFRAQKILTSMSVTVSSLIAVGPKLVTHYEQCHNNLFDFAVGNPFDGDFRRIVCDERLEKFFECMVKMWLLDCLGYDDANDRCVALQQSIKTSECSLRSFFSNTATK